MSAIGLPARLTARLARGRAMAEARMMSTAEARRLTGRMVQAENGREAPEWETFLPGVKCRIGRDIAYRDVLVGGVLTTVATRTMSFPAPMAGLFRDDDYVYMTSGENTGRYFQIIESTWSDQQTAYRVPVVGVARPDGWTV